MSNVTSTELSHISGLSDNQQTTFSMYCFKSQVDALLKLEQILITGGASIIVTDNLTFNRALISNGSGKVGKVAVSNVTYIEISYFIWVAFKFTNTIGWATSEHNWRCVKYNIIRFNNEQGFIVRC